MEDYDYVKRLSKCISSGQGNPYETARLMLWEIKGKTMDLLQEAQKLYDLLQIHKPQAPDEQKDLQYFYEGLHNALSTLTRQSPYSQRGYLIRKAALSLLKSGKHQITVQDVIEELARKNINLNVKRPASVVATALKHSDFVSAGDGTFTYQDTGGDRPEDYAK